MEEDTSKIPFELIPARCYAQWTRFLAEQNILPPASRSNWRRRRPSPPPATVTMAQKTSTTKSPATTPTTTTRAAAANAVTPPPRPMTIEDEEDDEHVLGRPDAVMAMLMDGIRLNSKSPPNSDSTSYGIEAHMRQEFIVDAGWRLRTSRTVPRRNRQGRRDNVSGPHTMALRCFIILELASSLDTTRTNAYS